MLGCDITDVVDAELATDEASRSELMELSDVEVSESEQSLLLSAVVFRSSGILLFVELSQNRNPLQICNAECYQKLACDFVLTPWRKNIQ